MIKIVLLYFLPIVLTVGFDETSYSADEGQDIVFTVVLSGEADMDVTVEFFTGDDTAIGE